MDFPKEEMILDDYEERILYDDEGKMMMLSMKR